MLFAEGFLDRMELSIRAGQPLHREDLGPVGLDREEQARTHGASVHQHGADSADAVFASEVRSGEVEIVAQEMQPDHPNTFDEGDMKLVGFDMTHRAAQAVYKASGVGPEDVDVIELHDAFAIEELLYVEAMGLCPPGEGAASVHGHRVVQDAAAQDQACSS